MDLGRVLATALAVRPGQEVKNLFWVDLIHVTGNKLNSVGCKYCMCLALVVVWYALFHSRIFFVLSVFALVSGKCYKPGGSRHPWRRMFPSFFMCNVLEVNLAVHLVSQKFPIKMREFHAIPGSMCPPRACVGNWSSWSWNSFVTCMKATLGISMTIRGFPVLYELCGALCHKQFPGAPVSATPVRMFAIGDMYRLS